MLRSDFVMKLMSVVLFVALAAYIGLYIFNAANKPLVTALAVKYTVSESGNAEGYIVRSETVLSSNGNAATLMAHEGEKLASGQAVAVHYEGETALERASKIRALQLEIKEAEADAAGTSGTKSVDADDDVLALSNAVEHKAFSNLEDLTLGIKKTIFTRGAVQITATELTAMKNELAGLLSENPDTNTIVSPMSGVFSSVVDGYESIGPDMLAEVTPSSLLALFNPAYSTDGTALGKLITGITWYYAAVVNTADALKLDGKTMATLQFTKEYNARLDMKIESIGAAEDGKCVVVFSAMRSLSDTTILRHLTSQIEFGSLTGLSIPKDAVFHGNHEMRDKTHIYLLTGLQAEKVYVDILSENGDICVVKDGSENGTVLREGSEIIVKANNLYDGKVVGR